MPDPRTNVYNTIIGENSFFEGRFMVNGSIRIDGKFEGEMLKVSHVTIGVKGKVKSNISAMNVVVEGVLIGNIDAKVRVMLLPTSRVYGDITTPEIIIQQGVLFEGKIKIVQDRSISVKEEIEKIYRGT
ncbi:MAG: polymer-forming cytoskeletal protein [Spirochaetia bacterium]|nr:polymer-forming cytoskeletal protein [Spirochaetota bacterium]MDW8112215.1 polymer-forming cytoskeletal protein [Spirochaetia bacterium]